MPDHHQAFLDESFHEATEGGFYVLAAAMFDPASYDLVRQAMREIRGVRNTSKLHWNEMDTQQRRNAVKTVSGVDGFHVVAIGTPVPRRRQERARAKCLHRLVHELHGYGVDHLVCRTGNSRWKFGPGCAVVGEGCGPIAVGSGVHPAGFVHKG